LSTSANGKIIDTYARYFRACVPNATWTPGATPNEMGVTYYFK
jgi:hypothetical protein